MQCRFAHCKLHNAIPCSTMRSHDVVRYDRTMPHDAIPQCNPHNGIRSMGFARCDPTMQFHDAIYMMQSVQCDPTQQYHPHDAIPRCKFTQCNPCNASPHCGAWSWRLSFFMILSLIILAERSELTPFRKGKNSRNTVARGAAFSNLLTKNARSERRNS